MKVQNMTNSNGNKVANQFIIRSTELDQAAGFPITRDIEVFQSYDTVIVKKCTFHDGECKVELDRDAWDYSRTTSKYRNQFLGETKAETQKKIDSGEYSLVNLNNS